MDSRIGRLLSLCAVLVCATALSVPVAGVFGIVQPSEAAAADESVLRIGFMQKIDSLNPNIGLTDAAYVFYGLVYDAFHSVGNNLETVGNLATEWRIVPETDPELEESGDPLGSIWEFNITHNAKWHDGEPFTVDDAVFTINLNANNYDELWAYQPYAYFMDDAVAEDEDTVRVHFYDRESGTPMACAYPQLICIPMLPEHLLRDETPFYVGFEWEGVFTDPDILPIIGTGPFMATPDIFEEYIDGDHITLVKNPEYHWAIDKGKEVQFDSIVLSFWDDATAMSTALKNGELDAAQFPPQTYQSLKTGNYDNITCYDGLKATQYWTEISFNMNEAGPNPSRLDPDIRTAIAMATDKDYIVDQFYLGLAEPGTTLISPVNEAWHYEPTDDEVIQFNIDAANALLDEAGYTDENGDGMREVTATSRAFTEGWAPLEKPLQYDMMIRSEFPEEQSIANYLEQVWHEIGVDINYRVISEAQLSTEAYAYSYDTMIWYWSADPDPNFMLFCQSAKSWNGWNDNMYTSDAYEENYNLSVTTLDPVERKTYTDNCQRANYQDCGYILLAYVYQTYAWRTDTFEGWGDWEANPGRSLDAFWTGNPLFFDLQAVDETPGDNGDDDGGWTTLVLIGAGIAAVCVVVAAIFLLKKKGGKKEREGGDSPLGD